MNDLLNSLMYQFQNFPISKDKRINALKKYFDKGVIKMPETTDDAKREIKFYGAGEEEAAPLLSSYQGSLRFHPDGKHMILKLGCREYICHNEADIMKFIEKELTEIFEERKRQARASARRKRLLKAMDKTKPKKKAKAQRFPAQVPAGTLDIK